MNIEPFGKGDIPSFLTLAAAEGWVAGKWEFDFLLSGFPRGCFVVRDDYGAAAGYVTSLLHDRSGWIGNLIVAEHLRGRGCGEALFRASVEALRSAGAQTIWLTASKSGIHLYEKHDFIQIDTISRWVGTVRGRHGKNCQNKLSKASYDLDALAWGDRRMALLEVTAGRGAVWQNESGFIVLQPCEDTVHLGPFSVLGSRSAESLFAAAIASLPGGTKILVDAPMSNRSASRFFSRRNMAVAGSSALMYAGKKPDYQPDLLYALATMGSCG